MEELVKRLSPMMRIQLRTFVRDKIWELEADIADWEQVGEESEAKNEMMGWLRAAKELEQALAK